MENQTETEKYEALCKQWLLDNEKAKLGNKAAKQRSRKISLALTKTGVGFRRESIASEAK